VSTVQHGPPPPAAPRVSALRSMAEVAPLGARLDALNLASRRPCPFATSEYLRAFTGHDELARPGDQVLFLCAWRGEELVGYLPLRRTWRRALGLPFRRVELLVSRDTDRPHVVARAEDEAACAEAFYRHLARHERWSSVELGFQDAASALWPVSGLPSRRFRVRQYPDAPNTTVPLPAGTLADFYRGLAGDFRNTVSRLSRRLLAAGRVEAVSCHAPQARRPLLDLYVDVERRSWKEAVKVGLARHPERLAFFHALCEPDQPLQLGFDFVLLDGVPISAMMSGAFGGTWYAFETGYDSAYGDLSPGYLTWLLAFRHGLAQGLRAYNLQAAYSYYKSRWNGVTTATWVAQVHRVPSLPWLKGVLGDVKRALLRRPEPQRFNQVKRAVESKPSGDPADRPPRAAEAAQAERAFTALVAAGVPLERLSGEALALALPFVVERGGPVGDGGGTRAGGDGRRAVRAAAGLAPAR